MRNARTEREGVAGEQLTQGAVAKISVLLSGFPLYSETQSLSQGTILPVGPGTLAYKEEVLIPGFAPSVSLMVFE